MAGALSKNSCAIKLESKHYTTTKKTIEDIKNLKSEKQDKTMLKVCNYGFIFSEV